MTGVRLEIERTEPLPSPCILVCNHCSFLDPVVLSAAWPTPLTFLVAAWVRKHWFFRHLVARLGQQSIDRGDPDAYQSQEADIVAELETGCDLAIFPEGGIEVSPGLRLFALGAFRLAARSGIPVVPVALRGTREAQPLPRVFPYPQKTVTVVVGPAMHAQGEDWASSLALRDQARAWIGQHCGEPLSQKRLRRTD